MSEIEDLSFEEAFAELEEVVQQLEAGDLTLDRAMSVFERGVALAQHCNTRLDAAELRVQELIPATGEYTPEGGYDLSPFEESLPDENR